jgi:hypothetical protein
VRFEGVCQGVPDVNNGGQSDKRAKCAGNRDEIFLARPSRHRRNPHASHRRVRIVPTNLVPLLPTRVAGALHAAAVGSFPFDLTPAASHNESIAVLRIGDPEPRGNAVRGA